MRKLMEKLPPMNDEPPVAMRFQRWINDTTFKQAGEGRYTGGTKDLSVLRDVNERLDRKVMRNLLREA